MQGKDGKWCMILGTSAGSLCVFDDREVSNTIEKSHNGAVVCLAEGGSDCSFLVSGGKDHNIKVWNQGLQPVRTFDLTPFSSVDATVASIDIRPEEDNYETSMVILVGTYGGEIIQVQSVQPNNKRESSDATARKNFLIDAKAEILVNSHFSGELWGLATHPADPDVFATVGDDGMLRVWSIKKNCLLKSHNIGWPARSIAWHPSASIVAVGLHEIVKGGYKKGGKQKGKAASVDSNGKGDHYLLYSFICIHSFICIYSCAFILFYFFSSIHSFRIHLLEFFH